MSECEVTVHAGVCNMTTVIRAKPNDDMTVSIEIESNCPMVKKTPVPTLVPWEEIGLPMSQSAIYKWASENIGHTACPVPCAAPADLTARLKLVLREEKMQKRSSHII